MRKIVLAQLSSEEAENIFSCERYIATFKTLLSNQFLTQVEKDQVAATIPSLVEKNKQTYRDMLERYNLPYIINSDYRVNAETNELYIEVY